MRKRRLGILATHPVQYHAPLYRALAREPDLDVEVFFAQRPTPAEQGTGFGVPFTWDVDLTSGYAHRFLENEASRPSTSDRSFTGSSTPQIRSIMRQGRFDAFLVMGWHARSYWQGIRAAWREHVPLLVRGDSQLLTDGVVKRAAKQVVYPAFMRRFSACLSVGTRSTEYFTRYGARRIVAAPHFVDNDLFGRAAHDLAPRRAELRQALGIPEDAVVACFAGKLIAKKRPLDVIEAVAAAGSDQLWLLVAGDGELRAMCESRAKALGVRVRFIGFQNQTRMPEAYAVSDVLVLPSDARETWGLVVNEAMASGRCALVSDAVGCAPDMIVPGSTGNVFACGDVARLARLLRELVGNRDQLHATQAGAASHVRQFTVDRAAAGVLSAMDTAHAQAL
jgi:glycosyltransferase involved in cell wall biosynthesis